MMFSSASPMGHFAPSQVKMAVQTLQMVSMELERQKMQACVNTEGYLDCLNKMLEPLAICQGMMGLRTWLTEVQYLMAKLKQRSFGGYPLNPRERQVLGWYSGHWRQLRGGACDMGRPEAQILHSVRWQCTKPRPIEGAIIKARPESDLSSRVAHSNTYIHKIHIA